MCSNIHKQKGLQTNTPTARKLLYDSWAVLTCDLMSPKGKFGIGATTRKLCV